MVYKTEAGKFRAVIRQVKECHEKGQPVLVGTVSIEKNELLSQLLQREGIQHNLLNAKNHEKEAEIVAQAGKLGAVTVATNMAGRGTDIMLGGNAEYLARADLVKAGYSEEVIVDATGYAETDNEEILAARKLFAERMAYHKADHQGRGRKGPCGRRPVHHRHRAPRIPPDRQPAPRPCRPSGRPRRDPVLYLPGGRPDAPVRRRPHPEHDGEV